MHATNHPSLPLLLTPKDVAWKLFEEARLVGWRTQGRDGIVPSSADTTRYRPQDVEAFIAVRLRTA